jgi:hypothetical protein
VCSWKQAVVWWTIRFVHQFCDWVVTVLIDVDAIYDLGLSYPHVISNKGCKAVRWICYCHSVWSPNWKVYPSSNLFSLVYAILIRFISQSSNFMPPLYFSTITKNEWNWIRGAIGAVLNHLTAFHYRITVTISNLLSV